MWRTFVYSISLLLIVICSLMPVHAQDTILVPLKVKVGIEVAGPAIYFSEKKNLNAEGYISVDLNEKRSVVFAAGYLNYSYSQYNYNYLNKGIFVRTGIDFNMLNPEKSMGRYWAGIGLRYCISRFTSEVPSFNQTNYWGVTESSIAQKTTWGHFVEVSPGVRAQMFKNFSMGWSVSLRMLVYSGTGKNLRPINFPGFGNGVNTFSTGLSYFIEWNIPYKKINVIIKKEEPEETEETEDTGTTGTRQQGTEIRH